MRPAPTRNLSLVAPESSRCSLKFQAIIDVSNILPYTSAVYAINNPFDPYVPTGGGAATGFAQWMGLYDFCFVDKVDLSISYFNTSTTVPAIMYCIPYPSYQTAGAPSRDVIMESQRAIYWNNYCTSSAYNPHTMRVTYNLSRLEGSLSPRRDYSCSTGYDPVHEITADVGVMGFNGAQTGFGGTVSVEIIFHCLFWQKKTFGVA